MITITATQDKASTEILLTVSKRIFNTGRPLLCLLFSAILTLLLAVTAGKSNEGRILLIFTLAAALANSDAIWYNNQNAFKRGQTQWINGIAALWN